MKFNINTETKENIGNISLFICAIGFEERSSYLLKKLFTEERIDQEKVLCFFFTDNINEISNDNLEYANSKRISVYEINSSNHEQMIEQIKIKISKIADIPIQRTIHIDYSSMPRNCYANVLLNLSKDLVINDKFFFWYSHGDYNSDNKHFSTAGADDFIIFSGKASIKPKERSHILGLGYDKVKSAAIRTVVDPSTLIVCYTYPQNNFEIRDTIIAENKGLFDSSTLSFSMPIEDFSFIIKKLREVVIDLSSKGDVILIPDGPKPLILACSIIPEIINRIGVICFHVKSHKVNFMPVNIKPTGNISGFSISKYE